MSDITSYQISTDSSNSSNYFFINLGSKKNSIAGGGLKKSGSFFKQKGELIEVLEFSRSGSNNLVRLVDSASLVSKKQHNRKSWSYKNDDDLDEFKLFLFNAMLEVFFIQKQLNKGSKVFIGLINNRYELRTVLPNVGCETVKDQLYKSRGSYNKQLEIIEKSIGAIHEFHQIKLGGKTNIPKMPDIDYLEGTANNKKKVLDLIINDLKLKWNEFFIKQCSFVHRDLKPDNICVDQSDNYTIIDFEFVCQNRKKLSESEIFSDADDFPNIHYWPLSKYQEKICNQTDFYNFMIVASQYCNLHRNIKFFLDDIYITKADVLSVKNINPASSCYNYKFIKKELKNIREKLSPGNKSSSCISSSCCFSPVFYKSISSGRSRKKQKLEGGPIINSL